jgi:hypothetical protein
MTFCPMAVVAAANRGLEGWKEVKRKGEVDDGWDIWFDSDGLFFGFVFLWDMVERRRSTAEKKFLEEPIDSRKAGSSQSYPRHSESGVAPAKATAHHRENRFEDRNWRIVD